MEVEWRHCSLCTGDHFIEYILSVYDYFIVKDDIVYASFNSSILMPEYYTRIWYYFCILVFYVCNELNLIVFT